MAMRRPLASGRCSAMRNLPAISALRSLMPDSSSTLPPPAAMDISEPITASRLDTPTTGMSRPMCSRRSFLFCSTISCQRTRCLSVLVTATMMASISEPVSRIKSISGFVMVVDASHTITSTHAWSTDTFASADSFGSSPPTPGVSTMVTPSSGILRIGMVARVGRESASSCAARTAPALIHSPTSLRRTIFSPSG